jgi:hypothetical protein
MEILAVQNWSAILKLKVILQFNFKAAAVFAQSTNSFSLQHQITDIYNGLKWIIYSDTLLGFTTSYKCPPPPKPPAQPPAQPPHNVLYVADPLNLTQDESYRVIG